MGEEHCNVHAHTHHILIVSLATSHLPSKAPDLSWLQFDKPTSVRNEDQVREHLNKMDVQSLEPDGVHPMSAEGAG